jgi:hypothetical protein
MSGPIDLNIKGPSKIEPSEAMCRPTYQGQKMNVTPRLCESLGQFFSYMAFQETGQIRRNPLAAQILGRLQIDAKISESPASLSYQIKNL